MLDNILDLVKNEVSSAISQNIDIPDNQKAQAVEATTNAVKDGFTNNLSGLTSLFSGGGDGSIIDKIKDLVSGALTSKVGLNADTASSIASSIVPTIVSAISGKIQDPNSKGFNLESVIGAFTGGESPSAGGLLGKIAGFFKK